jgi:hypothetical protein
MEIFTSSVVQSWVVRRPARSHAPPLLSVVISWRGPSFSDESTFPKWRKLSTTTIPASGTHDTQLYDPIFLMLFVFMVLSEHHPATPFSWIELFRTIAVDLCIQSLSSKDKLVRELGLSLLTSFLKCIEVSVFSLCFFNRAEVFIGLGISRPRARSTYLRFYQRPLSTIFVRRRVTSSTIIYNAHSGSRAAWRFLSLKFHISSHLKISLTTTGTGC